MSSHKVMIQFQYPELTAQHASPIILIRLTMTDFSAKLLDADRTLHSGLASLAGRRGSSSQSPHTVRKSYS